MRGLILKDLYMVWKYCKFYLLIIIFMAICSIGTTNLFMVLFSGFYVGIIPATLFSYDERDHWPQYCSILPCSRQQYVSGKYLTGLLLVAACTMLFSCMQMINLLTTHTFSLQALPSLIAFFIVPGCFSTAFCMPFLFRLGVEKGRMVYILATAIICSATTMLTMESEHDMNLLVSLSAPSAWMICLAAIILYAVSWKISVALYQNREL